jgi:hypothetical protein
MSRCLVARRQRVFIQVSVCVNSLGSLYPDAETGALNCWGALFPDAQIVRKGEGKFVMSTHTFRSNAESCHASPPPFFFFDNDGNEILVCFFFALHYCVVGECRLHGTAREEICDL